MNKSILFSVCALAISFSFNATVRTVSNNANSPGQYTSVQAAHDASSSNDTLLIHASDLTYDNLTINRPIVLIGEGYISNKQVQYTTKIAQIYLTYAVFPATTIASGTKIYGLNIDNLYLQTANATNTAFINNVIIERCRIYSISGQYTHSNIVVEQNVFYYVSGTYFSSIFSNNIVYQMNLNVSTGASNLISNNVFQLGLSAKGAVVSNNIFYNFTSSGAIDNGNSNQNLTWSKNLFFAATAFDLSDIIYGSNTGSGNIINVDPLFTTPELVSNVIAYTYTAPVAGPFADFKLQATSPGKNYGTDGTDIGIYGGGYPWIDATTTDSRFKYYTLPKQVPHMISMDILNPTIPVNGTLNIQFNAKTQQ